ncbi:hypothetical protein OH471_10090 [Enterococcus faecium]|uniref:hypothetical protein n=1 Tax=Enterococcus TaxID=1350 RepID=UPI0002A37506|nr:MULTISPECIES: hypothetical protein [Enterococcus]ELA72496.1 hypothetical protein OGQ_02013 [Enterococcus faecium EnGen0017]WHT26168.1 hypothetical protein OH471_10090 [Enterococcus faecium]
MNKKLSVKKWLQLEKASIIGIITLIGLILGELLNKILVKYIDSFYLSFLLGTMSIYMLVLIFINLF